jgi:hypothetical protein
MFLVTMACIFWAKACPGITVLTSSWSTKPRQFGWVTPALNQTPAITSGALDDRP